MLLTRGHIVTTPRYSMSVPGIIFGSLASLCFGAGIVVNKVGLAQSVLHPLEYTALSVIVAGICESYLHLLVTTRYHIMTVTRKPNAPARLLNRAYHCELYHVDHRFWRLARGNERRDLAYCARRADCGLVTHDPTTRRASGRARTGPTGVLFS